MSAPHNRLLDSATIALFVLALLAPVFDQWLRPDSARDCSVAEQRPAAPRPVLPRTLSEVTSFPHQFEDHYDDTFGLRDVLLRWNSIERWFGLGVSPARTIDPAEDGWCFFRGEHGRDAHRGILPLTEQELDGWVKRLRERRDFLASLGARYLFVPCPSKDVIYPERTPPTWKPVGPTRLDQLLERLEREGDIPFLDLRPALLAAKQEDRPDDWLYTQCGTHWNGRGIYTAYSAIVTRLKQGFPALEVVPLSDCKRSEQKDSKESMTRLMYISDLLPQVHYSFLPKEKHYEVLVASKEQKTGSKLVTRREIDAPRLLWLHDSYGPFLLMCESFSYVQSQRVFDFSADVVREARPDIVLETYVDRILSTQQPYRPILYGTPPSELFEQSKDLAWRDELGDRFSPPMAFGQASLEREESGLLLKVTTPLDGLRIPALNLAKGKFALLRIDASCTEPVELDVFVRREDEPNFLPRNHMGLALGPDTPSATVRLPGVGPRFETLIRLRSPASRLLVERLEIRRTRTR